MTHINIGDRVEYIGSHDKLRKGYKGTVVGLYSNDADGTVINVNWDKYINGHSCDGRAKDGHGWNIYSKYVELIEDNTNINPADAKYAHIIRKSKQLNERFVNRKKGTEYAF
jgi:hypothetical protein